MLDRRQHEPSRMHSEGEQSAVTFEELRDLVDQLVGKIERELDDLRSAAHPDVATTVTECEDVLGEIKACVAPER